MFGIRGQASGLGSNGLGGVFLGSLLLVASYLVGLPTVQRAVYLTEYQSRGVRLLPYRSNIAHAVAALGDG